MRQFSWSVRLRIGLALMSMAGAATAIASLPVAAQESWPARRVTLVVPFGAGSNTDALARWMAEHFKDTLGQPFIVENRGGAGGTLGANAAAKATPDGYTFLYGGNTTHSGAPVLVKNVPYDPVKDFTPVARIGAFSSVVVSNPQLPFRSMQEFVAYAKANPGKLSYGHGNSTGHIVDEAIKKRNGVDIARVPYTTVAHAITDVLANSTQLVVADLMSGPAQVRAGKLIGLATILSERSRLMPEIPTLGETVMPGFEVRGWTALFAPAGLPPAITAKMADAVEAVINRSDALERLGAVGTEPWFARGDVLGAWLKEDMPRWVAHAKEAGIVPQ